jgi:uncharacterized membrane protein
MTDQTDVTPEEPPEVPPDMPSEVPPEVMPPTSGDVTSDDRLWSALAYVFSPIVSIILILMEDKKKRPFIRYHAYQSLVLGVVMIIAIMILSLIPLINCFTWLLWIVMLYFAYRAYMGEYFSLPFVTDFIKKQGWA